MAKNPNPYGPQALTVQEATNMTAQRKVIRIFPTLAAAAISGTAGDVLVNREEIPNAVLVPGGCSKLLTVYAADYDDVTTNEDHLVIFHQVSAADFGTLDATAGISVGDLKLSKLLGFKIWDNSENDSSTVIDNVRFLELEGPSNTATKQAQPIFLQAEENSTSIYFSIVQLAASGATPDWDTGELEFIFHIEY